MNTFGWCSTGHHSKCRREIEFCYWDEGKKKFVYTGEIIQCECKKRGCKCYVKVADRGKTKTTRRKT